MTNFPSEIAPSETAHRSGFWPTQMVINMFMKTLLPIYGLAYLASAHMMMNTPIPYSRSFLKYNKGPLNSDGSDFPCRLLHDLEGASNIYTLGSTNKLTFTGQAVHGGGSCQVSITYDTQPTRHSVWKVIRSIEGGCPAQNQAGNMGNDAGVPDPYEYEFTIPPNIPSGSGTIAWTWFNKIGDREMYMNCGPLTLTGTGGSQANYEALPDMFVANIDNGCHVPDNKDVLFPDPGNFTRMNGATDAFASPTGVCGASDISKPTEPISTTPTSEPSPRYPFTSQVRYSNTSQPRYCSTSQDRSAPTSSQTERPATSSYDSRPSSDSMRGGSSTVPPGTPCANEGVWNCIDGVSFQRCASGMWSPVQHLASGTSCTPGLSTNFAIDYTDPSI